MMTDAMYVSNHQVLSSKVLFKDAKSVSDDKQWWSQMPYLYLMTHNSNDSYDDNE